MDIRTVSGVNDPYYMINREERFFCASLYSLLIQNNNNLKDFISYLNQFLPNQDRVNTEPTDKFEIYVEYSYLRDIWYKIGNNNVEKLNLIRKGLGLSDPDRLLGATILDLNKAFVGRGKPSDDYIQNPGTWSISRYAQRFPNTPHDNDDFLKVCKFKWSFNIKPDLVIQLSTNRVLSIEAKVESGEGSYPSSDKDKEEFEKRKLSPVGQIDLQRFMFEDLLGMRSSLFFLVKEKSRDESDGVHQIMWKDIIEKLDFRDTHPFIEKALRVPLLLVK